MAPWDRLAKDEAKRLSAKAMEENIHILQALADHDRGDPGKPWRHGIFVIDPRREFSAAIGSIDGLLFLPVNSPNLSTKPLELTPVGKAQSAST